MFQCTLSVFESSHFVQILQQKGHIMRRFGPFGSHILCPSIHLHWNCRQCRARQKERFSQEVDPKRPNVTFPPIITILLLCICPIVQKTSASNVIYLFTLWRTHFTLLFSSLLGYVHSYVPLQSKETVELSGLLPTWLVKKYQNLRLGMARSYKVWNVCFTHPVFSSNTISSCLKMPAL